jgi:hypothetical protein
MMKEEVKEGGGKEDEGERILQAAARLRKKTTSRKNGVNRTARNMRAKTAKKQAETTGSLRSLLTSDLRLTSDQRRMTSAVAEWAAWTSRARGLRSRGRRTGPRGSVGT